MYDIHIRKVPDGVLNLVQSGQAKVYGGIIRDTASGRIIGHLEQIGFHSLQELVSLSPVNSIGSIINVVQNQKIIHQLDQVTNMLNNLQELSWANVALSSINLGVSLVSFAVINNKLNNIQSHLNILDNKMDLLLRMENAQKINEISKILETSKVHVNDVKFYLVELESKGLSENLNLSIGKKLNEIKPFLEKVISQYKFRQLISVDLDIIFTTYISYLSLLDSYIIAKRKNGEDISLYGNICKSIVKDMISEHMINSIYQNYVLSRERIYTESEIESILGVYKFACEENYEIYDSHYQLLNEISIDDYIIINKKIKAIMSIEEEELVLITH